MNIQELVPLIGNFGLPCVIIIYMLWRFDKFLSHLSQTLEKNYIELCALGSAVKELVEYTKGLSKYTKHTKGN